MRKLVWIVLGIILPFQQSIAADRAARVMIVGTYHFSNPGADLHNMVSDDVLLDERQRQLAAIDKALSRFRPTRVAVEWPADLVNERYAKFLAGTLEPSRNEVVQLGFRVARSAKLEHVDGIDVEGDFPYEPVAAWAEQNGMQPRLAEMHTKIGAMVQGITDLQKTKGIAAALREMNRPEAIVENNAFYGDMLRYGLGSEQPGVHLLATWTRRNLEICARLVQAIKPGDRVIVFYGSGHSYLLRQCVRDVPGLELVEANGYLPK